MFAEQRPPPPPPFSLQIPASLSHPMAKLIFQICPFLTSVIREVPLFVLQLLPNIVLHGLDTSVSPADSLHFSKLPQGPLLLTSLYYHHMDVNTSSYGQVPSGHWRYL